MSSFAPGQGDKRLIDTETGDEQGRIDGKFEPVVGKQSPTGPQEHGIAQPSAVFNSKQAQDKQGNRPGLRYVEMALRVDHHKGREGEYVPGYQSGPPVSGYAVSDCIGAQPGKH